MVAEKNSKKLSDSRNARWGALLIVSFTMMMGYFFTDVASPLSTILKQSAEQGEWVGLLLSMVSLPDLIALSTFSC